MKFRIDLDITPEELRRTLGWPDVQQLHQEMLEKAREQLDAEGFDPTALMKLYNPGSMDQMQRFLTQLMSGYSASDKNKD